MPRFIQPKELVVKAGGLLRLRYLEGKSIAIFINHSSMENGVVAKIEKYISNCNGKVNLYQVNSCTPVVSTVKKIALELKNFAPDCILAVGGGSIIDFAKTVRLYYEYPDAQFEDVVKPFSIKPFMQNVCFVAIPTTSGSGAEASNCAVVTIETGAKKTPIVSNEFVPDVVILDPETTVSLPSNQTVCTAFDAFTHAAESYCSIAQNDFSSVYSITAGKQILENLKVVLLNPGDVHARVKLQMAAYMAGVAQSVTSVGGTHALAHALESLSGISHGHANAIFLPWVLKRNARISSRPLEFVNKVGFRDLDHLHHWMHDMMEQTKVYRGWKESLKDRQVEIDVVRLTEFALQDRCLRTNPIKLTNEDLREILELAQ